MPAMLPRDRSEKHRGGFSTAEWRVSPRPDDF